MNGTEIQVAHRFSGDADSVGPDQSPTPEPQTGARERTVDSVANDLRDERPAEAGALCAVDRIDHPGGVIVAVAGELDLCTGSLLDEQLDRAIGPLRVVVDLRGLQFMDSTGIKALLRADRRLREVGGRLVVVPGPRAVHKLFELTGLDGSLDFAEDPESVLEGEFLAWAPRRAGRASGGSPVQPPAERVGHLRS
jgi:anti-sigma B factor antagonist